MFKAINFKNYVSALRDQRTVYFSTLGVLKIYHRLSELLVTNLMNEVRQLCLKNPDLDHAIVTSSPSYCFALASCAEIAKNLLDPKLNITRVLIQVSVINNTLKVSFIDNGHGFPLDKVPDAQEISVTKVLNIRGPLSRGISSKIKGDDSGGGWGRGFAQAVDWFDALELDPNISLTFSRLNKNGGCVVSFCSPIAKDLAEKTRCEQAIANVLSDFSMLSDHATDEMRQQKMREIQEVLRGEPYKECFPLDLKIPVKRIKRIS